MSVITAAQLETRSRRRCSGAGVRRSPSLPTLIDLIHQHVTRFRDTFILVESFRLAGGNI